jgi:hypothetical protein
MSIKKRFSYDNNRRLAVKYRLEWKYTEWAHETKTIYSYDNAGNITTELIQDKGENNSWLNYLKDIFTYDKAGNTLSYERFEWRDSLWTPHTFGAVFSYNKGKSLEMISHREGGVFVTVKYQFYSRS